MSHIRGVANELAQEDLLVGVEGVDDEAQQLVDLRLEREGLRLPHLHVRHHLDRKKLALRTVTGIGWIEGFDAISIVLARKRRAVKGFYSGRGFAMEEGLEVSGDFWRLPAILFLTDAFRISHFAPPLITFLT